MNFKGLNIVLNSFDFSLVHKFIMHAYYGILIILICIYTTNHLLLLHSYLHDFNNCTSMYKVISKCDIVVRSLSCTSIFPTEDCCCAHDSCLFNLCLHEIIFTFVLTKQLFADSF